MDTPRSRHPRLRPSVARFAALGLLLALSGCAEDLRVPEAPEGRACSTYVDCAPNTGPLCGALNACVDGVCETEASLFLACE